MAWVALDRAVKAVEQHGLEGPVDRWRATRDEIHAEVCREGFDADRNTFVQYYGAKVAGRRLLRLPLVGFLAPDDPRVAGTIAAVEHDLVVDGGYVLRYPPTRPATSTRSRLARGASCPARSGWPTPTPWSGGTTRRRACSTRCSPWRNDVGLLAEEYDPVAGRLLGNFPQAFSHVGVVNTARQLSDAGAAPGEPTALTPWPGAPRPARAGRLLAIMWFVAISW